MIKDPVCGKRINRGKAHAWLNMNMFSTSYAVRSARHSSNNSPNDLLDLRSAYQ